MVSYATTRNNMETSRQLGIPEATVRKIVEDNKDKDEFKKLCEQKANEFSVKASRIINKALNRLERDIDDDCKSIPANHLTTVIGVLTEKKQLVEGKSTDNVSVSIKLPEGIDEYAG